MSVDNRSNFRLPEQLASPNRKIIRVPPQTPNHLTGLPTLRPNGTIMYKGVLPYEDILFEHGYEVFPGKFDYGNPQELGVGVGRFENDEVGRNLEIADAVGLATPPQFTAEEMLSTPTPVVAKFIGVNGGRKNYLLETVKQKAKYIVAQIKSDAIAPNLFIDANGNLTMNEEYRPTVEGMIEEASRGKINKTVDGVIFEKYIETPSHHYSSYQIIADAFGNIHYVALILSPHEKDNRTISTPLYTRPPNIVELKGNVLDDCCDTLHWLYTVPTSPFFLGAKSITSFHEGESNSLILAGQKTDDPKICDALISHGIDPNKAEPPAFLLAMGQKLGPAYRVYAPYAGFKVIGDKNGGYFYLGDDKRPTLTPTGLGMPEKTSQEELGNTVISRMLQNTPVVPRRNLGFI